MPSHRFPHSTGKEHVTKHIAKIEEEYKKNDGIRHRQPPVQVNVNDTSTSSESESSTSSSDSD